MKNPFNRVCSVAVPLIKKLRLHKAFFCTHHNFTVNRFELGAKSYELEPTFKWALLHFFKPDHFCCFTNLNMQLNEH